MERAALLVRRAAHLDRRALALGLALAGCLEEQRYAIERQSVHLEANAASAFEDDDDDPVFVAKHHFSLQITPPPDGVLDLLTRKAQGMKLPFPRLPWVQHQDYDIEVDYELENRSREAVTALVFLDGIDEFFVYTPGPEDFHQYEHRVRIEPGEKFEGTISEREMDEVAIDLATVVNGYPNSNQVVQFESQSGSDPRVQKYIPSVIPGLVGFELGIQSGPLSDMTSAPDLILRLSVRVQDHDDRIPRRGDPRWNPLPTPTPFVPVVPPEDQDL
jgi:hypothetical protein